jgi:hypothetical protein
MTITVSLEMKIIAKKARLLSSRNKKGFKTKKLRGS